MGADNQQGSLSDPSTTTRGTSPRDDDIVCSLQRCKEIDRNDRSHHKVSNKKAGLLGLAIYQFSQGQVDTAFQSLMAALTAFGLRNAIANATKVDDKEVK